MSVLRTLRTSLLARKAEWTAASMERMRVEWEKTREENEKRRASLRAEVERLETWLADPAHWTPTARNFHRDPRAEAIIPSDLPVGRDGLAEFLLQHRDVGIEECGTTHDGCFRVIMELQDPFALEKDTL